MDTIGISTTQNINIEYQLAGIADRILATLIDVLIQGGYIIALMILGSFLKGFGTQPGVSFLVLAYLPIFLYEVLLETLFNGQTFGKKARHIRVINIDGGQPTVGNYILRWLLRFVDVTLSMGSIAIVTILINGRGQRLGDLAAGTTVVKTNGNQTFDETVFKETGPEYEIIFHQAARLTPQQIEIIKSVLNSNPEEKDIKIQLAVKLQKILEQNLEIDSAMGPLPFLETILKDYNAIKGRLE